MSFSRQPSPIWWFDDLEGNILDDNYYAHFLTNEAPYLPQNVYHDAEGDVVWDNPLQFYANGTLPNNLYFNENLVYRIEIRRGATQSDPLIYEINNFVPLKGSSDDVFSLPTDNQITNPQFADVYFETPYAIVNVGTNTYTIAPGWYLTLEGAATMTLTQQAYEGDANEVGNPAFGLRMAVTGTFDDVKLYQRFNHSPAIWSRQAVSITLAGLCNDANRSFTVTYTPSNGTATLVLSEQLTEGNLDLKYGSVFLPESDSTDTGEDGYVDIVFDLPNQGDYELTNIQVVGAPQRVNLPYAQTTVERQTDQTFNVFKDSLLHQPKENLLVGWTFALNPWQFFSTSHGNLANNAYTADQTIIVQQEYVANNNGNNVAISRGTAAQNYAYLVTAVSNLNQFAILQYIAPQTIRPYWGEKLSFRLRAKIVKNPGNTAEVKFKAKLLYRSSLPSTISRTEPIATWTVLEAPTTYAAGWTAVNPLGDPEYTLSSSDQFFDFDQFQLPASNNNDMTLALMLYTTTQMDTATAGDVIHFSRGSLVRNDFAIDATVETFDQALNQCEFFYQKTFDLSIVPATPVGSIAGAVTYRAANGGTGPNGMMWYFKNTMIASPTVTAYSSSSANTTWRNITQGLDSGASSFLNSSTRSVFISNAQVAGDNLNDELIIHASADARLGK